MPIAVLPVPKEFPVPTRFVNPTSSYHLIFDPMAVKSGTDDPIQMESLLEIGADGIESIVSTTVSDGTRKTTSSTIWSHKKYMSL